MTDFNYKKYSLENLENWMHDAMSSAEASPQEIYDVIKGVVEENYYTYKHQASQAYELLALLNGNGQSYEDVMREKEYYEPSMPPWGHSDMEALSQYTDEEMNAMCDNAAKEDKVVKWQLPVEEDTVNGEYFITFPDDLLEAANLSPGDEVEWVEQEVGSFLLRKIEKTLNHDEAIAAGWTMTDDGFWVKE
jgi:bifunctional DNA-binding transcriptional regulator/antitoxin component of YhaV-PrlF toxin-antitoxin module